MTTKYKYLRDLFAVYSEDDSAFADSSSIICEPEDQNHVFARIYWRINSSYLLATFKWRKIENGLIKIAHTDTYAKHPLIKENPRHQQIFIEMVTMGMFSLNSNYKIYQIPTEREEMLLHWHAYVRWLGKNKTWEIVP